jgi:ParB family chromosome partitioning protein
MSKIALGKGLEGLLPIDLDINQVAEPGEHIRQLDIEKLIANPEQPRKDFDEIALNELASSIKRHGIIQPLVVTPGDSNNKTYRIVAGERRWRASKIAGLTQVPAVIRNHKELEELEIALVENVQRVDLSPFEQALSIAKLRDQFSLSSKEIAKKLGKAEPTISNTMRLLQLPQEAIEALRHGEISEGHARAILALKFDQNAQKDLLKEIVARKLSVREAEAHVTRIKAKGKPNEQKSSSLSPQLKSTLQTVTDKGWNVTVKSKKSGGSLVISYKNENELKNILEKF